MWRVLITCPHLQRTVDFYHDLFIQKDIEIESPALTQQLTESELLTIIDRFDGVIAGDDEFTAKVLEKGKRLKIISKWGIGVDGIDLKAAKHLGIRVTNTPNVFGEEVADVVFGYIILLSRQLHKLDQSVRDGGWAHIQGMSLREKTLGIIGVGSVGQAVAKRALSAGMVIKGYDVIQPPEVFVKETGIQVIGFQDLIKDSDFISLSCNLTGDNYHMLSSTEFGQMKHGVFIINTSRGLLIDEEALIEALREGRVAGAALDVFEQEPLPMNSPFRDFSNCIFGTHNSSNTLEAVMRVNELAINNLLEGLMDGA